jgi:hypothetical protein
MRDVVTYCKDTEQMLKEVERVCPEHLSINEETNERKLMLTKIPLKRNAQGDTLSLVRDIPAVFYELETFKVLGTYDELFQNIESLALYDSVYDRIPVVVTDEETGEVSTYMPPDKIGVFA